MVKKEKKIRANCINTEYYNTRVLRYSQLAASGVESPRVVLVDKDSVRLMAVCCLY